jgi:hypothetical protein
MMDFVPKILDPLCYSQSLRRFWLFFSSRFLNSKESAFRFLYVLYIITLYNTLLAHNKNQAKGMI